jgi:hypothetical protein
MCIYPWPTVARAQSRLKHPSLQRSVQSHLLTRVLAVTGRDISRHSSFSIPQLQPLCNVLARRPARPGFLVPSGNLRHSLVFRTGNCTAARCCVVGYSGSSRRRRRARRRAGSWSGPGRPTVSSRSDPARTRRAPAPPLRQCAGFRPLYCDDPRQKPLCRACLVRDFSLVLGEILPCRSVPSGLPYCQLFWLTALFETKEGTAA